MQASASVREQRDSSTDRAGSARSAYQTTRLVIGRFGVRVPVPALTIQARNGSDEKASRSRTVASTVAKGAQIVGMGVALLILMVCALTEPVQQWPSCDARCKQARELDRQADLRTAIAQAEARVAAGVAAATKGRDCWTDGRNRIPGSLVVHDVDGDEVRVVSFAAGYKAAEAGKVWVDAKCA